MAIVLLATQEMFERLNGYKNGNSLLEFVQDVNDNWVVGEEVLNDVAFADIHQELSTLEKINYVPKQID
jgi:hypothetical protein